MRGQRRTAWSVLLIGVLLAAAAWLPFAAGEVQPPKAAPPEPAAAVLAIAPADATLGPAATTAIDAGEPDTTPAAVPTVPLREAIAAAVPPNADANGIVVRVVDPERRPIGAAVVTVIAGERDLARETTGPDGRTTLPSWSAAVRASALGHWPTTANVANTGAVHELILAKAPRLRGRVFRNDGRVQAGADVILLPVVADRSGAPNALPPDTPKVRTDDRGAFELPWPDPAPRDLIVTAEGAGAAVCAALTAASCGGAPLVIVLADEARLVGLVHADSGPRPRGIEIWTTTVAALPGHLGPPAPAHFGQLLASAPVDGRGAFAVGGLPAGEVWLAEPASGAAVRFELEPGAVRHAVLATPAPAHVDGVVSGTTAGVTVFLFGGARWSFTTECRADGTFTFPPVPPGRYLLGTATVLAPALHAAVQDFVLRGRGDAARVIEIAAGECHHARLDSPAATTGGIVGRAFVGSESPTAFTVLVDSVPWAGARRQRTTLADDGTFELRDVAPGEYDVRLLRGDSPVANVPCRVRAGTATSLTLTPQ
jgi:hypothetical protein